MEECFIVEEVLKNIYRISVEMPKNPLRAVNCYFIRGEESDLLIDTCFRRDECRRDLDAGLAELGSEKSRRNLLLTHLHSDHSGLANEYAGKGCPIYMTATDINTLRATLTGNLEKERRLRMLTEGFPQEELDESYATNPAQIMSIDIVGENFRPIRNGEELCAGRYTLKVIAASGHTPGNAMFWMEHEKIMFSGDHVLFDVTPNIMMWPYVEDSLGDYLRSLHSALKYPVKLAFPGHRKPGDYHARILQLLEHHEERISETFAVVKSNPGLTAYEIAGRLTWKIRANNWKEFPVIQKWFAVGESLAHLDYLFARKKVTRVFEQGYWRYIT